MLDRITATRFALRLLGLALLIWAAAAVFEWFFPLAWQATRGNWAYIANVWHAPFHIDWQEQTRRNVLWLGKVLLGACLLFGNATVARLLWKGLWKRPTAACPRCGYDLAGLSPGTKCPECGGD